jgi:hypothetical protein
MVHGSIFLAARATIGPTDTGNSKVFSQDRAFAAGKSCRSNIKLTTDHHGSRGERCRPDKFATVQAQFPSAVIYRLAWSGPSFLNVLAPQKPFVPRPPSLGDIEQPVDRREIV